MTSERVTRWHSEDPHAALQQMLVTAYSAPSTHQSGGMTLFFNEPEAAQMMFEELVGKPDSKFHVQRHRFAGCMHGSLTAEGALRIPPNAPKLLEIESLNAEVIAKVDGALQMLFGEEFPPYVRKRIEMPAEIVDASQVTEKSIQR